MSLTIKIDKDEYTAEDIALFLEMVAEKVSDGFTSGLGWDMTGTDESEDDDDGEYHEEDDFSGATPDNGEGR